MNCDAVSRSMTPLNKPCADRQEHRTAIYCGRRAPDWVDGSEVYRNQEPNNCQFCLILPLRATGSGYGP